MKIKYYILLFFSLVLFLFSIIYVYQSNVLLNNVHDLYEQTRLLRHEVWTLQDARDSLYQDKELYIKFMIKKVIATSYNSVPWQTDNTPYITANGERVNHQTLALSRDLIKAENSLMVRMGFNPNGIFSYNDYVYIIYIKQMKIKDTMNRRFTGRADLWSNDISLSKSWGRKNVYIVKNIGDQE